MTTVLSASDVKRIAKATALEVERTKSLTLSISEVAILLGYAPYSSAVEAIIARADFPRPRQLNPGGRNRWLREDVAAWARSQFKPSGREILRFSR